MEVDNLDVKSDYFDIRNEKIHFFQRKCMFE